MGVLRKMEQLLESAIEGGSALSSRDLQPLDLVRQIQREIERNKRVFINDKTYVAHRMAIHLYAPTPDKVEEYEALFNNADFQQYLEGYIGEKGYLLLDRIRIGIECHQEALPQFRKRQCFVEFSWPQVSADPGEVTVVLDPEDDGKILSVHAPRDEVKVNAWLEVLAGDALQGRCRITRREFNIGRGEHVLHGKSGKLLRINHLAFKPPDAGGVVNRSISRQHARIRFRGGAFFLNDTGSQNGTSIERGKSVLLVPRSTSAGSGVELADGDILLLGRARVLFHLGTEPPENCRG